MQIRRPRTHADDERTGAAAVEMAIVLPFFMLLLIGLMQMSWMMLVWHSMVHAAREGARIYARDGSATDAQNAANAVLTSIFNAQSSQFTVATSTGPGLDRVVTVTIPFTAGVVDVTDAGQGGGGGMLNAINNLSALIPGAAAVDTSQTMTAVVTMRDQTM